MDKIYDSSYSITLDINVKLENEPQLFDSTYSICMAIYNKLGGEETNFDSTYSIVEAILPLAGIEYVRPFDSTYSLCLAIYDKLGGEPAIFDSTYSILLGILPLVEPGPGPGPEPEPLDKDYFYFQPLSTGDYSVSINDDVWKQKDTFEFRKANTNWKKFSDFSTETRVVKTSLVDYMNANPLNVVAAVDIDKYNQYIVEQGLNVGIYESRTQTGTSSIGKVATLLTTDSTYAYYTCELESKPTGNLSLRLYFQDSSRRTVQSSSRSINKDVPYMVTWAGTSSAPVVVVPTSFDVEIEITTEVVIDTISVNANEKLYLRNTSGSVNNGILSSVQNVNHNIGGILNTLTDYNDETYTLTNAYAKGLFMNDTYLISAENLKLPATILTSQCYGNMFRNCTSLTTAPELPATTLAYGCYGDMFRGCTSLTTAPELPATTLAENCYGSVDDVYSGMFRDCTSLTTAPELPATTLALGCYNAMFRNCTSLTTAPELPATTLVNMCYRYMFNGCTSLNKIISYAQNVPWDPNSPTYNPTYAWVSNVSSTGDFYNLGRATYPTPSEVSNAGSGIPSGWTVHNS